MQKVRLRMLMAILAVFLIGPLNQAIGQSQMFPLYGPTVYDGTSNFSASFNNIAGTYDVRCQYIPGGASYTYLLEDLTTGFDVWYLYQETETHQRFVNFVGGHTYRTSATPGPGAEPGNCKITIQFRNSVCYSVRDVWGLAAVELPTELTLTAYPNPANPTATISFSLPQATEVELKVYDINGSTVATLVNDWREAGDHKATFDGSNLTSGTYFYRLQAGSSTASGKMTLLK